MPLDINDFRVYKGGNPERIRESQRRRYADVNIVDEIIQLDEKWRSQTFEVDNLRKQQGVLSKEIGKMKKEGNENKAQELVQQVNQLKIEMEAIDETVKVLKEQLHSMVNSIGNYVDERVVVSKDETDNKVISMYGELKPLENRLFHHELLHMIGGYDQQAGIKVTGARGYFLKGPGVLFNQALINYGIQFLMKRNYTPVQPPYFMKKSVMAETAQLSDFDEQLYRISSDSKDEEDCYLIATSEQPISAMHKGDWLPEEDLPLRYAGVSTCFRKEAGSHGRQVWGIFRVHQFEKVEQFVITTPERSADLHLEMLKIAEEFYQSLGLSYRVISIVSGALNNAAAIKYDLEAWFPGLQEYRELVSCSNCTDYQSRAMETRLGFKKMGEREKRFVHMLNGTLCATERTICGILENYQTDSGIDVPEVLRPFMGIDFIPFVNPRPENVNQKKMAKAKAKKEQQ